MLQALFTNVEDNTTSSATCQDPFIQSDAQCEANERHINRSIDPDTLYIDNPPIRRIIHDLAVWQVGNAGYVYKTDAGVYTHSGRKCGRVDFDTMNDAIDDFLASLHPR